MDKEAIEKLLEEAKTMQHSPDEWPSAQMYKFYGGKVAAFEQILALLAEQPTAREFTKKKRNWGISPCDRTVIVDLDTKDGFGCFTGIGKIYEEDDRKFVCEAPKIIVRQVKEIKVVYARLKKVSDESSRRLVEIMRLEAQLTAKDEKKRTGKCPAEQPEAGEFEKMNATEILQRANEGRLTHGKKHAHNDIKIGSVVHRKTNQKVIYRVVCFFDKGKNIGGEPPTVWDKIEDVELCPSQKIPVWMFDVLSKGIFRCSVFRTLDRAIINRLEIDNKILNDRLSDLAAKSMEDMRFTPVEQPLGYKQLGILERAKELVEQQSEFVKKMREKYSDEKNESFDPLDIFDLCVIIDRQADIQKQHCAIIDHLQAQLTTKNKHRDIVNKLCVIIEQGVSSARPCTYEEVIPWVENAVQIARQYGLFRRKEAVKQALKEGIK